MSPSDPAARLRGAAAGLLTATLAVAAHGAATGTAVTGAAAAVLAALAVTLGALTALTARAADTRILIGVLAAGQLLGHLTLSALGHVHGGSAGPPPVAMLAAHAIAVGAGAALIAAGEHLCRAASRVVRAATRIVNIVDAAPEISAGAAVDGSHQPLRSALLLAASVSHRGPPVRHTC